METDKIITRFAPAQRASNESIEETFKQIVNNRYFNDLFSVIPNVILILNQERQTVYCNHALLEILGLTDYNSVLGNRPGELLSCIHSTEMPGGCGTSESCSTCGAIESVLAAQQTGEKEMRECRITVKKGDSIESLDIKVVSSQIDIAGKPYTTVHIMDISDEKRRRVLERIFFHDILNTAGIISGITEIIDEIKEKAVADEFMRQLNITSHRLIDEIKSQRQLLQAENGELEANLQIINSKSFLQGLILEYSNHLVAKNKLIILDKTAEDVIFSSDNTLLGRVVSNLIKNALEASAEKETVLLDCKQTMNSIIISVHNPAYIPRKIQLQIFQRSFSTKGTNRGIGTYSIKLLTEKYLKGTVHFTSNEEDGTTFFITLPKCP